MAEQKSPEPTPDISEKEKFVKVFIKRFFRLLNYLSIYAFILFVYGGALVTDKLLFDLMWSLLGEDVKKYPLVANGFDFARTGLALLFIIGAIIHGIISTVKQVQLDIKLSKEDE